MLAWLRNYDGDLSLVNAPNLMRIELPVEQDIHPFAIPPATEEPKMRKICLRIKGAWGGLPLYQVAYIGEV